MPAWLPPKSGKIKTLDSRKNPLNGTGLFSSPATSSNLRMIAGVKSTSATLDRVAVETSDTFDAGEINIAYI